MRPCEAVCGLWLVDPLPKIGAGPLPVAEAVLRFSGWRSGPTGSSALGGSVADSDAQIPNPGVSGQVDGVGTKSVPTAKRARTVAVPAAARG
jgi:hypothetical protein